MNLLHVTKYYYPITGGQEVYIQNLNKIFVNHDIKPNIIQPANRSIKKSRENVRVVPRIPIRWGKYFKDIDWFFFNLMLRINIKFIQSQDVVISHYPFHYPALKKIKNLIVLSHGVNWRTPPMSYAEKFHKNISKSIDTEKVIIVSNDTNFLREIGINVNPRTRFFEEVKKNVWFIPNCINTGEFTPMDNVKKDKVIFVPRNIRYVRGIHLAIEAFNLFIKDYTDYKLLIAGGPLGGSYYEYCQSLVNGYGLGRKVEFLGGLNNEQIKAYYHSSQLTLIPTIDTEGTSLSALESMACRTPVISTTVGGLLDLPTEKCAVNAQGMSNVMKKTLKNYDVIKNLQLEETLKIFNHDNWEKAWLRVIQQAKILGAT